ncbi:hypothetical protein DPEC_G00051400 [Dallia pectoralis]|uniref:Uncharacterized protein n=1 Tax=Dallia pectoralis TaxID=75939 RepID=A0ACC2HB86_DALPE|nr:hypothetical protein DPEC_G00051400 [Dallia pectoralis]
MASAWRTGVAVMLLLGSSAEASVFSLTEPVICYILDGVLLVYCIVVTGFLFRVKWCKSCQTPELILEDTHAQLKPGANDEYEDLTKTTATRRKQKSGASSDTYQALQVTDDTKDTYQVIQSKGKGRKKKVKIAEPELPEEESQAVDSPPPLPPH